MIGYIKGVLVWADAKNVILSASGVGYEISFYNSFAHSDFGSEIALYINQRRSEYDEQMYGFKTVNEKMLFESLVSIKGVGARVVFTILSEKQYTSWSSLRHLQLDDLVKIPGVGKATAQKFLLAVSNKLKKEIDLESLTDDTKNIDILYKSEIAMLTDLGLKKVNIKEFIKENIDQLSGKSTSQIIQFVLKNYK